uniref:Lysosomal cobalamin transport escort protein LMBD1 n=1 Tax=Eptatretus burgeri TaxID=7764 RepID=A0A8C4Q3W1_EPTBU
MAAESVGSGFLGWPGWLSFSLVLLAILAFSWFYIRYYQSWHESEMCSTITAILCLSLALMTAALFPVDIFLVSYMKNSNGKYKDWAVDNVTRQVVEDSILYGYYSLYSIMLFCIFFWLPFAYFYYEEKDDEYDHSSCSAYGMSALPAELIKGTKSMRYEQMETSRVAEETEQEILIIKAKAIGPLQLFACPFRDRLLQFVVFVNLDRAIHSEGFQTGFVLHNSTWSNPINLVLIHLQQVFPLDYIFIAVITIYFIFTSMSGLRNMGIWFFWMKLYKVHPHRTRPQALLLVCLILMLIVLYMSYALHILAPEYTMFGSQMYLAFSHPFWLITPACFADDCTVTRLYLFLHKFWFFTSIYYLGNWLFILVFLIGMTVSCLKRHSSPIEKALEDYDSDEEPLHM